MYDPQQLVQMDLDHVLHPMHDRAHNLNGPLIIAKGRGAVVTDVNGKEYIDAFAGLWCVNAGHGREELAEAAAEQIRTLPYASGYAGQSTVPAIELAAKLAQIAPGDLKATFFTTGGAVSNETAFKIARFYWKMSGKPDKVKIISRQKGYHGTTGAAMAATGQFPYWKNFDPLPGGFLHIPTHHCFRCTLHRRYPDCGVACADTLEQQILAEDPQTVAAFVGEPVVGAGGLIPPPPEYWPKVRQICSKYDVLLIADEVITGFGRTGTWFGQQKLGFQADLMSFAKGVTSAYLPLGGVMVGERVHKLFRELPEGATFGHAYTYSGHPVCCAVGLKNLEVFEREGLVARAATMGGRLLAGMKQLEGTPGVGEVRGIGLMVAIEMAADGSGAPLPNPAEVSRKVAAYIQDHGVLLRMRSDTIMMSPPLVISEAQVDRLVNVIGDAIRASVQ